jgi:tRNA/rRNA methyltransferase
MSLAKLCIILVRPKYSGNIGAVARAMDNFGVQDLRLVGPTVFCRHEADTMAVHARGVLDRLRVYPSLREASADCQRVIGTTCRPGLYREGGRPPRSLAAELVPALDLNRSALVFGPEDTGLTNTDLRYCHGLVTIPTAAHFRSLNVAQAVLVCCYEIFLAGQNTTADSPLSARQPAGRAEPVRSATRELALAERQEFMYDKLQQALLTVGFLHRDNPDHIMLALRRILGRAGLEDRDVRILLGLAHQISWYATRGWRLQPPESQDTQSEHQE